MSVPGQAGLQIHRKGWEGHKFAQDYISTKVAIGDVDGDGQNEIILAEGDPCIYGKKQGGKLAWFKSGKGSSDMPVEVSTGSPRNYIPSEKKGRWKVFFIFMVKKIQQKTARFF